MVRGCACKYCAVEASAYGSMHRIRDMRKVREDERYISQAPGAALLQAH